LATQARAMASPERLVCFWKKAFVFAVVLNGVDRSIGESDLEILIAIFAGTMMHCSVGVISGRHQTAIEGKVFIECEAFDAVNL